MRSAYIGIDLAVRKGKRLPVVISRRENNRLIPYELRNQSVLPPRGYGNAAFLEPELLQRFADKTKNYLSAVCEQLRVRPVRIAIDAPQTARNPDKARREAEYALDRAGISCFTTPSDEDFETIRQKVREHLAKGGELARLPHANQLWMLYGFVLFKTLSEIAPCIEVYPQAIVRALGAAGQHKSKQGAVTRQLAAASRYTGWPQGEVRETSLASIAAAPGHDSLDAYLSSWVASLDEKDRVALGVPPQDAIWVPRVQGLQQFNDCRHVNTSKPEAPAPISRKPAIRTKRAEPSASDVYAKTCPACNEYTFKRWPFGWDAHAGHRCSGLEASSYEERKAEFKSRFHHLFK